MEFTNVEVADLTANVIPDQMYIHCYKDGNYMLLLSYFFHYIKRERALFFSRSETDSKWEIMHETFD